MGRIKDSVAGGKFLVYKADSEMRVVKVDRETEGAYWVNAWNNIQKHKAHRLCNHNKEAQTYAHICQDRIDGIKKEDEYLRLEKIKTESLLAFNKYKKDRTIDIIENTAEDYPEYFI